MRGNKWDGKTDEERFWEKVDRSGGPDACWPWIPLQEASIYAYARYKGTTDGVHRIAYRIAKGPIEKGKLVRHKCDFRRCCNPAHLLKGTHKQNSEDMVERGRQASGERHGSKRYPDDVPHGEKHGMAWLTDAQVEDLRKRYAGKSHIPYQRLADDYDCSRQTIWNAIHGANWTRRSDTPDHAKRRDRSRYKHGEDHGIAKLTEPQVLEARADHAANVPLRTLAQRYHVANRTIREAIEGITWSHLPGAIAKQDRPQTQFRSGTAQASAKLDDDMVRAMRAMGAEQVRATGRMNVRTIAAHFERSYAIVYDVMRGKTWRHVV